MKKQLWKEIFKYALSAIIVTYAFVWLYMLMFKVVPAENREIVNVLSGQLVVAGTLAVIYWHFGSSSSSDKKTEIIANGKSESPSYLKDEYKKLFGKDPDSSLTEQQILGAIITKKTQV